ncbi:hypothetical protein HYT01_02055 [Candidatus Giovannonibacteria bacterium]|nr:hypothetical protein [Candidatus Giovannonibacteria bacterium]
MPKQGFIQILIIIALLVIILSLLGVSLKSLFTDTLLKDNFKYLGGWMLKLWDKSYAYVKDKFATVLEEKAPSEANATTTQ